MTRLRIVGAGQAANDHDERVGQLLGCEELDKLDLFDRLQLASEVCREAHTLSAAGRALFTASRGRQTTVNDADRLRKYLARFGLQWSQMRN